MTQTWPVTLIPEDPGYVAPAAPPVPGGGDPFRLSANVKHRDGGITRWAADDIDPENQPGAITFGTVNPGGFGTFSHTLPRGLEPGVDENLLDSITYRGPGGQVAYEGRLHRLPRTAGDDRLVTPQGVGWSSHLSDFRAFRELYVDRTTSRWRGMGAKRKYDLMNASYGVNDGAALQDSVTPAIQTALQQPWTTQAQCEAWYDGGGIPLGAIAYFWQRNNLDYTDTNWEWGVRLEDADDSFSGDTTGSLRAAGASYGYLSAVGATRRFALAYLYNGHTVSGDRINAIDWTNLIVYGDHGLARRGAEPNAGFFASDIIRDVIQRTSPRITIGDLAENGFIIPQAAFYEPTTATDVILKMNAYALNDWFVWEDRVFSMVSPDPVNLTWNARVYGQGSNAKVKAEGDDVLQMASSAYVFYSDPWGRPKVYGPTGGLFCTSTSDYLLGDGSDPYSLQGIDAPLTLNVPDRITDEAALQIGRIWLAEQNAPTRSGTIDISGFIDHPTEGPVPCWRMRAGDYIRLVDRTGDIPRKIVSTSYNHQSRTVTCTLQAGPLFRVEGLLQRLGVQAGILS